MEDLLKEVLERVTPTPEEEGAVGSAVERALGALRRAAEELSIQVEVEVEGSFVKGTWLSGDVDVDVFLLFDPNTPLEELRERGLALARRAVELLGADWKERYASHPYLTLELEACDVDVVPAYRVPNPSQIRSPVDRTPFHTAYVKRRLEERPELKGEVRLLKRFAKGIGVYGAEIRVEGFSGYLLELLTTQYGSFLFTLRAASRWRPYNVVLDPGGLYSDLREVRGMFYDPLVVIDPVDPKRNVASPVSLDSMCTFIAAARAFLRRPSAAFFFPPTPQLSPPEELLRGRGAVAVRLSVPPLPEEVLWGQAKRALRALSNGLERHGFTVIGRAAWAGDGELVLLLELKSLELPPLERHKGPPVYSGHDERFVEKYLSEGCVAGPYVEGDRWAVVKSRRLRTAVEALERILSSYNIGEALRLSARGAAILVGESVAKASANDDYKRFLAEWLARRPRWLP